MILEGQEMDLSLGTGVFIDGFNDHIPRKCFPYTLENISMLNVNLSIINQTDLYENFRDNEKTILLATIFKQSFRTESDEETLELLHTIDSDNFPNILSDIKKVNGIVDNTGEIDIDKTFKDSSSGINWSTAINSIPLYSSTPLYKVKDMTLIQFNETLRLIGKKINWQYKVDTVSLSKEPSKYIQDSEHPLYNDSKPEGKKFMTMADISGFMGGD